MSQVVVNGVELHYRSMGQGPDLVMVHGLAANLAFWFLGVAPRLARRFRVTAFDLRGHGESGMPPRGYTTADMAADLGALMDHLALGPVHLVGHSFGGAVALDYSLSRPDRVNTLGLLDCRLHALQPFPPAEDIAHWNERRRALEARGIAVAEDTPRIAYTMLEEFGEAPSPGVAHGNGLVAGLGVWNPRSRAARKWLALRSTTTIAEDVREVGRLHGAAVRGLAPPALLLYGGESRCLDTCRGLERLLPDVRTEILPGLGHFFPVHAPEATAARLVKFLDARGADASRRGGEASC